MSDKKPLKKKLAELEELVAWFEQEDLDIEQAIGKFETGSDLASDIRDELSTLENKITVLRKKFEGEA